MIAAQRRIIGEGADIRFFAEPGNTVSTGKADFAFPAATAYMLMLLDDPTTTTGGPAQDASRPHDEPAAKPVNSRSATASGSCSATTARRPQPEQAAAEQPCSGR
jgi:hypothetical protein